MVDLRLLSALQMLELEELLELLDRPLATESIAPR